MAREVIGKYNVDIGIIMIIKKMMKNRQQQQIDMEIELVMNMNIKSQIITTVTITAAYMSKVLVEISRH